MPDGSGPGQLDVRSRGFTAVVHRGGPAHALPGHGREHCVLQADRARHDVLDPSKARLPQLVADDGNRDSGVVVRADAPSTRGSDTERGKQARRDAGHLDPLGQRVALAFRGQRRAPEVGRGKPLEGPLALRRSRGTLLEKGVRRWRSRQPTRCGSCPASRRQDTGAG